MKLSDMTQAQQVEHLRSTRDRMITIYRQTGNPAYKNGREPIAHITVGTEPDGTVSIGIGTPHLGNVNPTEVEVQFIDDEGDRTDDTRRCPHGWAKLQPEGVSLCPECSAAADTQP